MLTIKQVKQLKKHSKEAVESLPEDHPWIHFLGALDALCDTALELYASMNKKEVLELQELFDRIVCLAVEGPEVATKGQILEAIRKEAITGYNLCKQILGGKTMFEALYKEFGKEMDCPYDHQHYKDMGMTYCPHCLDKFKGER